MVNENIGEHLSVLFSAGAAAATARTTEARKKGSMRSSRSGRQIGPSRLCPTQIDSLAFGPSERFNDVPARQATSLKMHRESLSISQ